jgi:hypothetical protein
VERFQSETAKYKILGKLLKTLIDGWPESIQKLCDPDLNLYWDFRENINISDGLVFKEDRIITPLSMRHEMLKTIHVSYMGIEKKLKQNTITTLLAGNESTN